MIPSSKTIVFIASSSSGSHGRRLDINMDPIQAGFLEFFTDFVLAQDEVAQGASEEIIAKQRELARAIIRRRPVQRVIVDAIMKLYPIAARELVK